MKLPILWRRRLEYAPKADIRGIPWDLHRYKDPETGCVYIGRSRYDPLLVDSCINHLSGMTVEAESDR